jgi:hypothetical protein
MPSRQHEALIEIFGHRPSLAAELLSGPLGVELPDYQQARLDSADLTEVAPTEYRADAVVVLTAGDSPVLAVVVEVQLGRDPVKRWSWPVYLTTLRARLRCPTVLLVICPNPATASWYAHPIPLGHPGLVLTPLVLGPNQVPVVVDPAQATRLPELAVLSAMAHGAHPDREEIWHALLTALATVDRERSTLYSDVVLAALPVAARRRLEALMATRTYEYQSEFVRRYVFQGRAEGRAEGKASALLAVLDARGVAIPDDDRRRIAECTDLPQLDEWLRRAATAHSIQDVLAQS